MLCEINEAFAPQGFLGFCMVWGILTLLGLASMLLLSGSLFYCYYGNPTFESWQYKSNPKFPSPLLVKKEIIHMLKGLSVATLCPAFSLVSSRAGLSKGYCGEAEPSNLPLLWQALLIFFFTDLYEYIYHCFGHAFTFFWQVHRHHHRFYNPSPFAVIADEYLDQFVRTWPMIILPAITPINIDLLFVIFATLFYGYGVYLHWGYESQYLSAHNPIFNTAYHHYIHHAISAKGRTIYTGFFFKLWDNVFQTTNPSPCSCYECRPRRSKSQWTKTQKHDYSVLLSASWWLNTDSNILGSGGGNE